MSDSIVRESATKNIIQAVVIGLVLTGLSYVVGLLFGWVDTLNWLEIFAVFTSYASTYLCVVERRFNYVFGAVSVAAFAVLFWQFELLASAALNAYLLPTLLYGWFIWKKDAVTRPVMHVQLKWVPVYLAVTAAAWFGAVQMFDLLGADMAWTDSAILAGTILAQFLLDRKKIENWIVWAVVNMFAIYTYATAGLALAAFQYVFFLANTVYGYLMWKKSMKDITPQPPAMQAVPVEV